MNWSVELCCLFWLFFLLTAGVYQLFLHLCPYRLTPTFRLLVFSRCTQFPSFHYPILQARASHPSAHF